MNLITARCTAIFLCSGLLAGCDANQSQPPQAALIPSEVVSQDEFAQSFRVRNDEIRTDMINVLTERNIPFRLNADGSIGYREADGPAIDAAFSWVVGLYAARN